MAEQMLVVSYHMSGYTFFWCGNYFLKVYFIEYAPSAGTNYYSICPSDDINIDATGVLRYLENWKAVEEPTSTSVTYPNL